MKKGKKRSRKAQNLSVDADMRQNSQNEEFQFSAPRMSPQIKCFCLVLVESEKHLTVPMLAKRFSVAESTIYTWKSLDVVKCEIEKLQLSAAERTKARLEIAEKPAVRTLVEITKDKRANKEVRRKSANDILGFAGRKNINKGRVTMIQGQQQAIIDKDKDKTIEQLLEEEREIDELLGENE